MTQDFSQRVRRRRETAQSLTVAISVLFLLLFLGGIFIAIVINNLRGARTGAKQTASSRFAQAGLEYMDRQLTEAPEGADWRPRPDFANGAIDPNDPDFDWLRPCNDPSIDPLADPAEPCGYTRINFGGDDPTVGNLGGRALVRVSYLPYRPLNGGGSQPGDLWDDVNRNGAYDGTAERVCRSGETPASGCIAPDPTRKYIKLESVGRAGIIVTGDPTTYARSQGKALLYEKVGYKSIGLNEYVRYITNKDGSPTTASLGSIIQVKDAPAGTPAARPNDQTQVEQVEPRLRDIPSIYYGPIRSNASLRFHGPNYLFLDPRRNDALEVAGLISLANVNDGATILPNTPQEPANDAQEAQSQLNPGRVWVTDIGATGSIPPAANPNVFPSGSAAFSLLGGLVRDNAAGVGTPGANLRHVARQSVPTIDLGRYRSLTQNAEAMAPVHTGPNPVGSFADPNFAGTIGWGANMYIGNSGEVNRPSNALIDAYSPRVDWLTPGGSTNWQTGFKYEPPGVTITFTPRFIIMERTATRPTDTQQRPFAFRDPATGNRLTNMQTIVRYTDLPGGPGEPTAGFPAANPGQNYKFAGYPATALSPNVFQGDFLIFAEGNVRVRGVIGGKDPETARYFLRHLTVVSGGTIYIDGNLLRDNLGGDPSSDGSADNSADAARVRGRSTIALLAKEYVTVNTTQFLKPGDTSAAGAAFAPQEGPAKLSASLDNLTYQVMTTSMVNTFDANGRITGLVTPNYGPQRLFLRHASAEAPPKGANILLTMNQSVVGGFVQDNIIPPGPPPTLPGPFSVVGGAQNGTAGVWLNSTFELPTATLFPANTTPYAAIPPTVGMMNRGKVLYDLPNSTSDYLVSRLGVSPLDVRVEALMYAQEGSFFIIPGPWLNANPNDTYLRYMVGDTATGGNPTLKRDGENALVNPTDPARVHPRFPFYGEPQDIRLTFFGAISENLPAEVGDQGAWLEKWGWVPRYQGSMGLPSEPGYPVQADYGAAAPVTAPSVHGPIDPGMMPGPLGRGAGIVYSFDDRLLLPYGVDGAPLRADGFGRVLPAAPRLPVAPGMLYYGERTR